MARGRETTFSARGGGGVENIEQETAGRQGRVMGPVMVEVSSSMNVSIFGVGAVVVMVSRMAAMRRGGVAGGDSCSARVGAVEVCGLLGGGQVVVAMEPARPWGSRAGGAGMIGCSFGRARGGG